MSLFSRVRIQRSLRAAVAAVVTVGIFSLASSSLAQDPASVPPVPSAMAIMPNVVPQPTGTPKEIQHAFYDLIWKTFVAVNWPSEKGGQRGEPDLEANILDQKGTGHLRPSVWETYKEPSEVFISPDGWANYPDWNTRRPQPPVGRSLKTYSSGFTEYATGINQPYFFDQATGPLVDRNRNYVRYEVAINQAFFTYIKHFRYYDANRQIADVARTVANPVPSKTGPPTTCPEPAPAGNFQRPPHGNEPYLDNLPDYARQGLVDLKAAWRVLDPAKGDQLERYLHREIVVDDDGTTQLMGLVALHILRYFLIEKTIDGTVCLEPAYVASTFEQVDNVCLHPRCEGPQHTKCDAGIKASFHTDACPSLEQATYGFELSIPPLARSANPKPRKPVHIYRAQAQALPDGVVKINRLYQGKLEGSVFEYYELIGTQNKHPGTTPNFTDPDERRTNGHEGPNTGVYSNTNNLVNSVLESYTQKNFTCLLCHVRARPKGVPEKALENDDFKTLTFLLQMAQSRSDD